ncbi:flavin reductase [Sorangium sp. So ce291]|uniref:flavin reductase family protein n=1 Tax=Sorangium sp. So ce291 TaxID=3133294 RepID=UPI003F61C32E
MKNDKRKETASRDTRGASRPRTHAKKDFPVAEIRRFLEPGPIVLVSSAWKGETNIMTMGWHTVMEFAPSLVGCMISSGNHSFELIRRSKECVINVPTVDLAETVRYPRTIHYRGDGVFMLSGESTRRYRRLFRPEML